MKKLYFILADSGLELVPRSLWNHPAVRSSAMRRGKRPGEILLDISLHYSAMKKLKDYEKRGRPDIVHICLLIILSSLLNIKRYLQIYVHTYDNKVIEVDSSVRIPRNYNRFIGLMEQLLIKGKVPPDSEKPLLRVTQYSLSSIVREHNPSKILILDEEGILQTPRKLARVIIREELPMVIVGAFQKGKFSREVLGLAHERIAISKVRLDSWTVISRIISSVEDEVGIYEVSQKVENSRI